LKVRPVSIQVWCLFTNEVFSPTVAEVAAAARIVTAYEAAQESGRGAIEVDGKMVDVPVALRARAVLHRHERISNKSESLKET